MFLQSCRKSDVSQAHLENVFNGLGYIPLVSSVTGPVRAVCGAVQGFFGSLGLFFRGTQYIITRNPEHRYLAADNFMSTLHGKLNITRGGIEAVPVAGNVATFVYDNVIGLRANYTFEDLHGKDPLFDHHQNFPHRSPMTVKDLLKCMGAKDQPKPVEITISEAK